MTRWLMAAALLLLAGCSSEPAKPAQAEKPQPKPTEFETGRVTLQLTGGRAMRRAFGWNRSLRLIPRERTAKLTCGGLRSRQRRNAA